MQVLSIFQCVAKVWNSWVKMEQMLSTCPWPKSLAKNSAPDRRICFFFFFFSFLLSLYFQIQMGKCMWAELRFHQGNRCYFLWSVERPPNNGLTYPSIHCSINGGTVNRFKDLYCHACPQGRSMKDWGGAHLFEAEQGVCTLKFSQTTCWWRLNFLLVISKARSARNLTPNSRKEDEPENGVSRIAKVGLKQVWRQIMKK